jgi:drug/metabolite transporter superfamily protein YnfA
MSTGTVPEGKAALQENFGWEFDAVLNRDGISNRHVIVKANFVQASGLLPKNGEFVMIRERALKVLLVLSGLACLAGLYPLTGALRDGAASTINRQDQMILGIYISLGVFLLIAARNPRQNRSLILFAGWSTLAHDGVMIVQGIQYHDLRNDLLGFAIIAVIGLALIALTPAKQAR